MTVEGRQVVLRESPVGGAPASPVAGVSATGRETVTVRPGAVLEANCTMADSLPAATLMWLLNGVPLNSSTQADRTATRSSLSGYGWGSGGDSYQSSLEAASGQDEGAGLEAGQRGIIVSHAVSQRGKLEVATSAIRLPAALFDKHDCRLTCVAAHPSLTTPSSAIVDLFIQSMHE